MKKILVSCLVVGVIIAAAVAWLYQVEVRPGEKINPFAKTWGIDETFATALKENNPKICDKINSGHIIQDYGVSPKQAREECKYRYAIEKNALEYCITLSSKRPSGAVSTRDVCVRELAVKRNDPELCDLMPSGNYISLCKQTVNRALDEMSNWKTYHNQEYGFEVKYPLEEIKISVNEGTNPHGVRIVFPSNSFSIIVASDFQGDFSDFRYLDLPVQERTSDGFQVYSLKNSSVPFIALAKQHGGKVYIIEFAGDIKLNAEKNQILSTFKFVDSTVKPSYVPCRDEQPELPCTPDYTSDIWQTYQDEKLAFEFKYPEHLKLLQENGKVILNHTIPYENHGDCDMVGENKTYTTLGDFNLSFELMPRKITLDFTDGEYTAGILKGSWVYEGAEGCGEIVYYFSIEENKTLVVRKAAVQALSGISTMWNREEILKVPSVISPEESERIFKQILSTFKFIK